MGVRYDENFAYFEDNQGTMEEGGVKVYKLEDLRKAAERVIKKYSGHYDTLPDIPKPSVSPDQIESRQVAMVIFALCDLDKKIEQLREDVKKISNSIGMIT